MYPLCQGFVIGALSAIYARYIGWYFNDFPALQAKSCSLFSGEVFIVSALFSSVKRLVNFVLFFLNSLIFYCIACRGSIFLSICPVGRNRPFLNGLKILPHFKDMSSDSSKLLQPIFESFFRPLLSPRIDLHQTAGCPSQAVQNRQAQPLLAKVARQNNLHTTLIQAAQTGI